MSKFVSSARDDWMVQMHTNKQDWLSRRDAFIQHVVCGDLTKTCFRIELVSSFGKGFKREKPEDVWWWPWSPLNGLEVRLAVLGNNLNVVNLANGTWSVRNQIYGSVIRGFSNMFPRWFEIGIQPRKRHGYQWGKHWMKTDYKEFHFVQVKFDGDHDEDCQFAVRGLVGNQSGVPTTS